MKNNSKSVIGIVVVIIVIVAGIVWFGGHSASTPSGSDTVLNPLNQVTTGGTNSVLPVSETTKSGSSSQYQNAELGFSVSYPTSWEKDELPTGVQFIMPIDQTQVSTVAKLEADITVSSGKCSFPPVTTVDSRSVLAVGNMSLNTISMSNSVQGRSYFNRMYSYENSGTCYIFAFSYIALSPDSKGLTGSNLTQAQNNNKAIQSTADAAFTAMVKTFALVAPPKGQDETQAPK